MRAWLLAHWRALASAVSRLARHPVAALFEVFVLGIALALPVSLYLAVDTLRNFVGTQPTDPELSVFLVLDTRSDEVQTIESRLRALDGIADVRFVPRQQAYQTLRKTAPLAEVLDALPDNPLPDAYTIRPRSGEPATLERLRRTILGWPRVASVQVDSAWARKLEAGFHVGRAVGTGLAVLFAVAALAVIFNTTRLQMSNRRQEIELTRLIGATNAYIRRPYVYFGALQAFFGAASALGLAHLGSYLLRRPLAEFSTAYGAQAVVEPVSPAMSFAFLIACAGLGALAAWLAASRHLWAHPLRVEP